MVKPKKSLGQHFLKDENIALQIVDALQADTSDHVLEIGPGTGVLTKSLLNRFPNFQAIDFDLESIGHLKTHFPEHAEKFVYGDVLKIPLDKETHIVGNFPYNISSQILFKVFEQQELVPSVVGMFQREVAQRIASPPGNKTYGILSVLLQASYDIEYLFSVSEEVFYPPPKVKSGVLRFTKNKSRDTDYDRNQLKQTVKLGFNQRRKTLRNSLKSILQPEGTYPYLDKRPEQLDYVQFIELTKAIFT